MKGMVLHHVSQGACRLIVGGAPLHTDGFTDRKLHMVDVLPVPDRLEDTVREPQRQDVLFWT